MKFFFATLLLTLCCSDALAQWEFSTGYAVNKNDADGAPINLAYDFKIKNRLFTKSQFGYKYLYRFNDFVGAKLKVSIIELHQTLSYEVIKKRKYIFKPNIGINYRFYHWKGEMVPPLNTLPIRAWVIGLRNSEYFILESRDGKSKQKYDVNNFGFSVQLQNQFRLNKKLWMHITPFMEPDYDRSQNTGGVYVGAILKNFN